MGLLRTMGAVSGSAVFLLSAGIALAQEEAATVGVNTTTSVETRTVLPVKASTTTVEARARMEAARAAAKAQMEARRASTTAQVAAKRTDVRANMDAKRAAASTTTAEARARMEAKRASTTAQVAAKRAEVKAAMEAKREEAKQRLAEIRDKKKQELAARLNEQFDKLNTKWTDHFIQVLDQYDAVLLKIQARAGIGATSGNNVASTTASVQVAQTAIATARTAVIAQAAKSYTLNVSTTTAAVASTTASSQEELVSGLRTAFQTIHKSLFDDLKGLRDGVIRDARSAVQAAHQALRQIPKIDEDDDDETASTTSTTN